MGTITPKGPIRATYPLLRATARICSRRPGVDRQAGNGNFQTQSSLDPFSRTLCEIQPGDVDPATLVFGPQASGTASSDTADASAWPGGWWRQERQPGSAVPRPVEARRHGVALPRGETVGEASSG